MRAILDSTGRPINRVSRDAVAISRGRRIKALYDAAQTTVENERHWAQSDGLSALSANSPEVRRKLRNRARYETANNSYASGIVQTLANDCIGTGPRLQLLSEDGDQNTRIERAFMAWARAVRLPAKLRTMRMARAVDGEAFAIFTTNPNHAHEVMLDLALIEADQVASSSISYGTGDADGIEFDAYGNPRSYNILEEHPGNLMSFSASARQHSADQVIHWFRVDRPGQRRGVPDLTPALHLFAQLRRYTLAALMAAEVAAENTMFLKTNGPALVDDEGQPTAAEIEEGAFFAFGFDRGMMTTLPEGWDPFQLKAEQPTTTYAMFKHEILNEIARCMNMPYNIAACNSSNYNYASGRLDHQTYYKSIRVEQSDFEGVVLDRIFGAWLLEASYAYSFAVPKIIPHQWFWDGHEHVDPAKEATAQAKRLASMTTTRAAEYAKEGKDWETELRQLAKENELMQELGLIGETNEN